MGMGHHSGERARSKPRASALAWALALAALAPFTGDATAQAWSKSTVRTVAAQVRTTDGVHATTDFVVGVEVLGGWLGEFALEGVPEGVRFAPGAPPRVASDPPGAFFGTPEAEAGADDGTLTFRFDRKSAPRAGLYRLMFSVVTPLERSARGDVLVYQLPAWQVGLDDVSVSVVLPEGSRAVAVDDAEQDGRVQVREERAHDRTAIVWSRAHLPRLTPWRLHFQVPSVGGQASSAHGAHNEAEAHEISLGAVPAAGLTVASRRTRPANARDHRLDVAVPWVAGLLLFLVLAGALRGQTRAAERRDAVLQPWAKLPRAARLSLTATLVLLGGWGWEFHPFLGAGAFFSAVLLGLERTATRRAMPRPLGRWRAADALDLERGTRAARFIALGFENPLDGTTSLGVAVLGVFVLLALVSPPEFAGLWLVPATALFVGTRARLPKTPEEVLVALHTHRARGSFGGVAPMIFESASGAWFEARLRRAATPAEQELGLELVELAEHARGPHAPAPVFTVTVGSPAEALLGSRGVCVDAGERRSVWVLSPGTEWTAIARALEELGQVGQAEATRPRVRTSAPSQAAA